MEEQMRSEISVALRTPRERRAPRSSPRHSPTWNAGSSARWKQATTPSTSGKSPPQTSIVPPTSSRISTPRWTTEDSWRGYRHQGPLRGVTREPKTGRITCLTLSNKSPPLIRARVNEQPAGRSPSTKN